MRTPTRLGAVLGLLWSLSALAHDIPNARIDRAIQVDVHPGRLTVIYEVSLAELTLTQDLRNLIGSLPEGTADAWYRRYGQETGPLNALGLLVTVDSTPIELGLERFDVVREDHPRFTFLYRARIPTLGNLRLVDTNYAASEGTSRLAARAQPGVLLVNYEGPADVASIPIRPVWQLSAAEERAGKQVRFSYRATTKAGIRPAAPTEPQAKVAVTDRLSSLLDRSGKGSLAILMITAFGLGVVHSLQPGHGKSLIVVASLDQKGRFLGSLGLGLLAASAHMASVAALGLILWITVDANFPEWNARIVHATGFVMAAIGLHRLGEILGPRETDQGEDRPSLRTRRSTLAVGLTAGVIPCWDAVGLLVLSAALRRLPLGLVLIGCFSLGLATVLVMVGSVSLQIRDRLGRWARWSRPLRLLGAGIITLLGASFLAS